MQNVLNCSGRFIKHNYPCNCKQIESILKENNGIDQRSFIGIF